MDVFINPLFYNYYQKYPIKLVDIGASGGLQGNWKKAEKYLQHIGFEPDNRSFRDLEKSTSTKDIYINKALYKNKTKLDFYSTKQKTASSMFAPKKDFVKQFPEAERYKISEISKIEAENLDNQLALHHIDDVDFIKLDTQGSELFILEGAAKSLNDVFGLEIEVEFSQIYEKQPLFSDVDKFVRGFGFQLFDLKPYYWKRKAGKKYGGPKGQLIFADALYLATTEHAGKRFSLIRDSVLRKSKILRSISIALLYGYVDYALAIFEREKRSFNKEEIKSFYKEMKKNVRFSTRIPYFPGKGRIAGLFRSFYNKMRHHHNGWAIAQEFLGNLE